MSKEWVPGLEGIVAAESNISFIDGQEDSNTEDSISKRSRITAPSKRQLPVARGSLPDPARSRLSPLTWWQTARFHQLSWDFARCPLKGIR